jgi:hypothetical protein
MLRILQKNSRQVYSVRWPLAHWIVTSNSGPGLDACLRFPVSCTGKRLAMNQTPSKKPYHVSKINYLWINSESNESKQPTRRIFQRQTAVKYEGRLKSSWTGGSAPRLCSYASLCISAAHCRQATNFSRGPHINLCLEMKHCDFRPNADKANHIPQRKFQVYLGNWVTPHPTPQVQLSNHGVQSFLSSWISLTCLGRFITMFTRTRHWSIV